MPSTASTTIDVFAVEGLSIAVDSDALTAAPAWTRIDNLDGVTVARVEIKRGRPDEKEKTAIGELTAIGVDRNGWLDPTNPFGPFWDAGVGDTKLDPVKQVGFAVKNPLTDDWWTRFMGHVDELEYEIDVSGKFARFTLHCVDALDIITDAEVVPDQAGNIAPGESVGDVFYEAAQVDDRLLAVMADTATALLAQAWPPERLRIFSGNVVVQGKSYSAGEPMISVVDEACDAEFPGAANRYIDRLGVFTFHGRYARFHPDVVAYGIGHWKLGDAQAFAFDPDVAVITQPFKFTRGKTNLINAALVTPNGIKPEDVAGQFVYDTTSLGKYGPRSVSFPNLITLRGDEGSPLGANAETKQVGQYYVDNFKRPQNRPGTITITAVPADDLRAPAIWALLCRIDLSDLAHLTTTHPGGGGIDADFFVEQISETHLPRKGENGGDRVEMQLEVSPRAYFDTDPFSDTRHE
jgi:hypothetical protein